MARGGEFGCRRLLCICVCVGVCDWRATQELDTSFYGRCQLSGLESSSLVAC